MLDQLLADVATAAFGEQGVLGTQFHAWGVGSLLSDGLLRSTPRSPVMMPRTTPFSSNSASCSSEARVDFHAQALGLLGQPAAQVAQGDDVVAFVVHGFRHKEVRN